jgi:hypothetical protein
MEAATFLSRFLRSFFAGGNDFFVIFLAQFLSCLILRTKPATRCHQNNRNLKKDERRLHSTH